MKGRLLMAKNKYFLIVKYKTKEEFEKNFNEIYSSGYEDGFKNGRINALSYILDALDKDFSGEEHATAQWQTRTRTIRQWQKEDAERKRKEQQERNCLVNEVIKEASEKPDD